MEASNISISSVSSESVTLSWIKHTGSFEYYLVGCTGEVMYTTDLVIKNTHSVFLSVMNSTSVAVNNLVPDTSYNCCISAVSLPTTQSCEEVLTLESRAGLTAVVAGVIGGALGMVIGVLVLLAVLAVIGTVLFGYKKCRLVTIAAWNICSSIVQP